jgi:hypothetical protein
LTMLSQARTMAEEELMFLGDILCIGIIKKGLLKVGASPDTPTPQEMAKALDAHVEGAIVSFVGPQEARQIIVRLKGKLAKLDGGAS